MNYFFVAEEKNTYYNKRYSFRGKLNPDQLGAKYIPTVEQWKTIETRIQKILNCAI